MLNGQPTNNPPETITEESYNKATVYLQHLHAQKENNVHRIHQGHCMRDLGHEKIRSTYSFKALFYANHFCQQCKELYQHVRSACDRAVI